MGRSRFRFRAPRAVRLVVSGWVGTVLLGAGCGAGPRVAPDPAAASEAGRVVVVQNLLDPASRRLAARYRRQHGLSADQVISLALPFRETIGAGEYLRQIEAPVREHLDRSGRRESTDFILLTRGLPIRVRESALSVDALLGAMDLSILPPDRAVPRSFVPAANPYFGRDEPFRRAVFGFYLVTRLDGYDEGDARALLWRAAHARPRVGPFLLDVDPRRAAGGYAVINGAQREAAAILRGRGHEVRLEETADFARADGPLAGYYSWGSNDGGFDRTAWRALRFLPGALAETAVSTSARTFRRSRRGQTLVADLIERGVTGVQGYVAEPTTRALARADLLFDRYTRGYTLAESFGMATPVLKWRVITLGDPLCAPYRGADPGVVPPAGMDAR